MAQARFGVNIACISCFACLLVSVSAAQQRQRQRALDDHSQITEVAYPVIDLVIGTPSHLERMRRLSECAPWLEATNDLPPQATSRTMEEFLMRLAMATVSPESWQPVGGVGTIEYSAQDWKLIVKQTQANHEKVANLLASVRRVMDVEVAVQIRLVSLPPDIAEAFRNIADIHQSEKNVAFLNDRQLTSWLKLFQANRATDVIQARKVTGFNGQEFTINIGDSIRLDGLRQAVVAERKAARASGGDLKSFTPNKDYGTYTVSAPAGDTVDCGFFNNLLPIVSADRRFVRLKYDFTQSDVKWSDAGEPRVHRLAIHQTIVVPDNGTAVFHICKTAPEVRPVLGPPLLSTVPYINRLFTHHAYAPEAREWFAFVTTRVIIPDAEPRVNTIIPR